MSSSDQAAIAAVKADALAALKPGEQVIDGDVHSGSRLCSFNVTDKSTSYHVVIYGTNASPTICADFAKKLKPGG